jgi:glycosyltransferase involved in cell wall biosynthesis
MLYLVGTGPQQQELEEMAVKEGVDHRVRFLGWRNDALCIMAAADMIVHPSLEDALSSAVIEAVMLQKPVVASDISGVRDTLGNGQYGIIVPPADDEALEKGIRQLIANMVMAKRNAADGKRYLLEYMGAKRVADSYTELYIKLLTQSYA